MWNFIVEISLLSGGLIPLMAVLLVVTIAVIIERLWFFNRVLSAGRAIEHDVQLVGYQQADDLRAVAKHYAGTVQAAVLDTALATRAEDADAMDRQIDETIMWQVPKLDRFMWVLDTAVTLGPLLGLFGTIIGMIESFGVLGTSGTSNPTAVTGGIAHALVATAGGLFIAIIAIVFLNYFNKRLRLAMHQLELLKVMLVNRLHGGGSEQHGKARGSRAPVAVASESGKLARAG
jgi:biopolymer transport protein ExbB